MTSLEILRALPADSRTAGALLRIALFARGRRAKELAAAAGCSPQFLSKVMKGDKPVTPRIAVAAERLLGVDALELIRLDNEQSLAPRLSRVVELRCAENAGG